MSIITSLFFSFSRKRQKAYSLKDTHTHTHQIITKDVISPKHLFPDMSEVIRHLLQNSILNQRPTFAYGSIPMTDNLTANSKLG